MIRIGTANMATPMPPTPILCVHGRAIAWTGTAMPGDRLPAIEHCAECFPFTIPLST